MKLKLLFIFVIVSQLNACAYKEYDESNPDDYAQYWCDPKHKQLSIFKPHSTEPEDRLVKTAAQRQQRFAFAPREQL